MANTAIKKQVYKDPRPLEDLIGYYNYAQGKHIFPVYYLAWLVMAPLSWIVFRLRVEDHQNVPKNDAVVLAPNHFSNMDHFFMGAYVRRKVRFMAKSQMFKNPMALIYKFGGVFPVRRGHRDELSIETAESILENGGAVAMYCEGGRSRSGKMAEAAKPGIGRVVLETGSPVVPIAIHGSEHARNWKRLSFPPIVVKYGQVLRFDQIDKPTREQQQQVADQILEEIKNLYGEIDQKLQNQHPVTTFVQNYWRWTLIIVALALGINSLL